MKNVLKSGEASEAAVQKAIFEWISYHPQISDLTFHFPNEGKRSKAFGAHLKKLGMKAGVADIFIAMPNEYYCGLWIELKTSKGVLSHEQSRFLTTMSAQGYCTAVCRSFEEAVQCITTYMEMPTRKLTAP